MKHENHKSWKKWPFQVHVSKLQVGFLYYIKYLIFWAKEIMASKLWTHGENWPQRFDLYLPLYDLSLDIMVPGVWQIFRADFAVILRYCKSNRTRNAGKAFCINTRLANGLLWISAFTGFAKDNINVVLNEWNNTTSSWSKVVFYHPSWPSNLTWHLLRNVLNMRFHHGIH